VQAQRTREDICSSCGSQPPDFLRRRANEQIPRRTRVLAVFFCRVDVMYLTLDEAVVGDFAVFFQ
jgi:hypothetical protein